MILDKQTEAQVITDGESNDSTKMSLDLDSAQILMQMLSKNLYSDAIGSTIRETCSNALDSHRRANVKEPIVVSFNTNKDGNFEFSVEDFGIGLDDDDVKQIISKYGKSTKRNSANELGMMGLGFKAPLAYTSSFYFIGRKNGVERKYIMYEGEESNMIDLLTEVSTNEKNGVKVIIPVKYSDQGNFVSKMKEQLAYFEDIFFDSPYISNDFKIHRSENYQLSGLKMFSTMHLCLDNVYYPIDFAKLEIGSIDSPIALRFGLSDGLFPTPNRESLRYTQEAKTAIIAKLKKVATELVSKFNESISEVDHVSKVFEFYSNTSRIVKINDIAIQVNRLAKFSDVPVKTPTLKGIELLDLAELADSQSSLVTEYSVTHNVYRRKITESKAYDKTLYSGTFRSYKGFVYSERIPLIKKEYIKHLIGYYDNAILVKKTNPYELGFGKKPKNSYYNSLKLYKYPKSQWRQLIKEFQLVQKDYISEWIDVDSMIVPQSFIDSQKSQKVSVSNKRDRYEGTVLCKEASELERYMSSQYCKFVPTTLDVSTIHKNRGLIIYGSYNDSGRMDDLYQIFKGSHTSEAKIYTMSDREKKVLDKVDVHNLITIDKFMEGDNKPFKRFVTAYLISKLISKYPNLFSSMRITYLKYVSKSLHDKLSLLLKYRNENLKYADPAILESMLTVAKKNNLFDYEIYHVYLEMENLLSRLTFLEPMMDKMGYGRDDYKDPLIPCLIDLFKYYKCRIDYQNYKIDLNQDESFDLDTLLTDSSVSEEIIDELIEESNN